MLRVLIKWRNKCSWILSYIIIVEVLVLKLAVGSLVDLGRSRTKKRKNGRGKGAANFLADLIATIGAKMWTKGVARFFLVAPISWCGDDERDALIDSTTGQTRREPHAGSKKKLPSGRGFRPCTDHAVYRHPASEHAGPFLSGSPGS